MEDMLLKACQYLWGVLGIAVFMLIINILVLRDKTGDAERGDKERERLRDKSDASLGILRGKDAYNFQEKLEAANKEARRQGRL